MLDMLVADARIDNKILSKKVSCIGLGYVGLPVATIVADAGFNVRGIDVAPKVVETLNTGSIHIVEPGLDEMFATAHAEGRISASVTPEAADIFIIAVPTHVDHDSKLPDMGHLKSAVESIAHVLKRGDLVIIESTIPVGCTEDAAKWLEAIRDDLMILPREGAIREPDVMLAHCPERILPGVAMEELISNDRIIGGLTPQAASAAAEFYNVFVEGDCHETSARVAEMCKLVENSYRDVNIAFANELSLLCDEAGIDTWEVIEKSSLHPRVNILQPGPGVGGHCIAIDPWYIVARSPELARMIRTAREINDNKAHWVADQIRANVEGKDAPVISCLGLSYKPDIDDLRESPSITIIKDLAESHPNATILAVEPHVDAMPRELQGLDNVELVSWQDAAERADVVALLVGHREFRNAGLTALTNGKPLVEAVRI
ncbi:MAG: UDP-N-acetyl-D-mannosamine dehydrogenase VpsB [Alphaproteobacteria bacterium]